MKYVVAMLCCAYLAGCNETSREAGKSSQTDVTVKKPVVDQAATSALEQKEDKTDITITSDIRKRVVGEKLSVEAQNIKIISRDGTVTLRGSVKSADEKQKIADVAAEIAGVKHVIDEIDVEAPK
jgi:osmotically-inducible protein OsmY